MKNRILSLFGLQGVKVLKVIEYYRQIFIYVYPSRKTADCPTCSKRTKTFHQYCQPCLVRHLKLGKRQTFLVILKRRFKCKNCHKVFTERVRPVAKWQRKTKALEEEVIESLREMSFASVKRKLGVGYQAQVKLLKKAMSPFEGSWELERKQSRPISMGIDEHSFSGHDMVLTITDLTTPALKSILPNDKKATLDQYLSGIPAEIKPKVNSFCIDMKAMYKYSIKRNFPQAKIVIDHFHLIYDANRRIDEERRITQNMHSVKIPKKLFLKNRENLKENEKKILDSWFKRFPDLKTYWFVKESLRTMYKLIQKQKAKEKLTSLIGIMYKQRDRGLSQWADILEYWQDEILNFFDYRITNAYTEGIHTKLKLIKRIGFGFKNKEVYIRKAALACLPLALLPQFS